VLKYPVRKTRDHLNFWFIRQSGVYHKYASDPRLNHWLLIFPNAESYSASDVANIMTDEEHPLGPHLALHFSHIIQWRWYMADFHGKVEAAVSEEPVTPKSTFEIELEIHRQIL
jgi:hypothetical protein